ncbi:MAG: RodZ domain-containing protein [Candidatus Omnitrophota bacterium]
MVLRQEIGKVYAETRKKRNITVSEAYAKSRIHPKIIDNIETGQFDKIEKPYLKSFLKKYAMFLGIDPNVIIEEYNAISSSLPEKGFQVTKKEERKKTEQNKEENPPRQKIFKDVKEEKTKVVLTAVISAVLAIVMFNFFGSIKSKWMSAEKPQKQKTEVKQRKAASVKPRKKQAVASKSSLVEKSKETPVSEAAAVVSPVMLTLKARDKVWIQVNEGDDMLFAGILKKGESKNWKSSTMLTVWTGKADVLDFIVNTRKVNSFATGVVKNIQVSSQGIKVGDVWVTELE